MRAMAVTFVGMLSVACAVAVSPPMRAHNPEIGRERGPPNYQTDPAYARIDRERGAVLCSWLILTELKAIHQQCHAAESPDIERALDRSLERFHTFIVANSAETRERLEAAVADRLSEARAEAEAHRDAEICAGDVEEFYRFFTRGGADGVDEWTERTLAVPRPPVLDPCL